MDLQQNQNYNFNYPTTNFNEILIQNGSGKQNDCSAPAIIELKDENQLPINNNAEEEKFVMYQYEPNNLSEVSDELVVDTLPPKYRFFKDNFGKVVCDNVTTMWINRFGFSFLTKPSNDENNFFLPLHREEGFQITDWSEDKTKNLITRELMTNFVDQFNDTSEIVKILKYRSPKRVLLWFLPLIILILFCAYLMHYRDPYEIKDIAICLFVCVVLSMLVLVRYLAKMGTWERDENMEILELLPKIGPFISHWNENLFLPRGLYVIVPLNLRYIQFVLDRKVKFTLKDHAFPEDLRSKLIQRDLSFQR